MHTRDDFVSGVKLQLEQNIFFHSLAVEACMGGIYDHLSSLGSLDALSAKREDWLLAGLIHDIDYSGEFKKDHPNKTKEVLEKLNLSVSDTVINIVKAHSPENTGVFPKSMAEWAIYCSDSLTGLITAVALIYPSKKLSDVKTQSVLKRFLKEPKFASGTRRAEVAMCEKADGLNIPLEKFIEICLFSMQKISKDILL